MLREARRRLVSLAMCVLVVIGFCGTAACAASMEKDPSDAAVIQEIEAFVEKQMKKGKVPGLQLSIVKGSETVYQNGFGYENVKEKKAVTENSFFELGSNSKAFTAIGVMQLVETGALKLEDEISVYLPWLNFTYKGAAAGVTVEQLLHHTSGIPFKSIDKIPVSSADSALEDTVKTLAGTELANEPGSTFEYATINYDVLGLVIQELSGQSYEAYTQSNVLDPLELTNTYMFEDDLPAPIATGYKVNYLGMAAYDAPVYRGNKPAGYIISNGEDMAKWMKIQLGAIDSGSLDAKLIEETHVSNRTIKPLDNGNAYAAGWFVTQKQPEEYFHVGNNPNYSSYVVLMPDRDIGISVLLNTNTDYAAYIGENVKNILQGKEIAAPIKDMYLNAGAISIMLTVLLGAVLIASVVFLIRGFGEIQKKERRWNGRGMHILVLLFSFLLMGMIGVAIYLMPYILYQGVSWTFIRVWMPVSFQYTIPIALAAIAMMFLYVIFNSYFQRVDKPPYFMLCILSVVSGFGNALVIFTINMTIGVNNEMRVKLLLYFAMGLLLYICGQKAMRSQLVQVTNGIVYSKRMEIVRKLLNSDYERFEQIDSGVINATLNNDTEKVSEFANTLINGVTAGVTLVCCFTYLGFVNLPALLMAIGVILLIASIYFIAGQNANKIADEARDMQNVFFQFIKDLIGGMKELSLRYKKKAAFEKDMDKSCQDYREKKSQAAISFANMIVIGELVFTLAIGIIVFVFPLFLKNLTGAVLTSFVFILLYMVGPVNGILDMIPISIEVRISMSKINKLIKEIDSDNHVVKQPELGDKGITLKLENAAYVYQHAEGHNFALGPVNCSFKSGEITFITGGNGSGKSTLAKLVTGLYSPSSGKVTLNGKPIEGDQLGECYTTVFSDFYLFKKLYGIDTKKKKAEIKKYLKLFNLNDKVHVKDGEFSTIKLSTGQKKRLALMVAYLEDKEIFLFDEWAADQDPEFRYFFYDTLLPELKNRKKCVIAITHDDHYFGMADKVIKLDMGKLVES